MRNFYKIIPDRVYNNSWTLRKNGVTLRRMARKEDLVAEASARARSRGNSVLEIRRANGQFAEYRLYN